MKKYYITIILLVILSNISISQRTYQIKDSTDTERISYLNYLVKKLDHDNTILDSLILNTTLNPKLSNYYKNIYKAEDYIMKSKYEKAAETYQTAFTFLDYPFVKDLNFALRCEMLSRKNEENIKKYIWLLLNKNEDKDRFLNDSLYYNLPYWGYEIKPIIDTAKTSINQDLVDSLKQLYDDDQEVRRKNNNETDSLILQQIKKQIDVVDSINYYKILTLLEKFPDISEEVIGEEGFSILSTLCGHSKYRLEVFIKLLPNVHNGNINARLFTFYLSDSNYLCDNLYYISSVGHYTLCLSELVVCFKKKYKYLRLYRTPKKEKKRINRFRKKLYCEDINKHNKKLLYQLKHNEVWDYYFDFYNIPIGVARDESAFFYAISHTDTKRYKIYYRTRSEGKRFQKEMKEYYKNNPENDTDTK